MKSDQDRTLVIDKNRDKAFFTLVTTSIATHAIAYSFYLEMDDDEATIRQASCCVHMTTASTENDGRGRSGYCVDKTAAQEKRRD